MHAHYAGATTYTLHDAHITLQHGTQESPCIDYNTDSTYVCTYIPVLGVLAGEEVRESVTAASWTIFSVQKISSSKQWWRLLGFMVSES